MPNKVYSFVMTKKNVIFLCFFHFVYAFQTDQVRAHFRECSNYFIAGSLLSCKRCRRSIGFVSEDNSFVLHCIRLMHFSPFKVKKEDGNEIMFMRMSDCATNKRRIDIDDHLLPFKKRKIEQNITVMRVNLSGNATIRNENVEEEYDPYAFPNTPGFLPQTPPHWDSSESDYEDDRSIRDFDLYSPMSYGASPRWSPSMNYREDDFFTVAENGVYLCKYLTIDSEREFNCFCNKIFPPFLFHFS